MGDVVTLDEAKALCGRWRAMGLKVVFTNGHFDVLHIGHVDVLQRARALGDALVVGLNSDASTRQLKGPLRPIIPEAERSAMLAALACVDLVVLYGQLTASHTIAELRPDVYAKGGDWRPSEGQAGPPEVSEVLRYGGEVHYLPYMVGRSTSSLIRTIVDRFGTEPPGNALDAV